MMQLDLLQHQEKVKTKSEGGKRYLWDSIRKKYLIQTPEEWVRQLLIIHLVEVRSVSRNLISVEKSIQVNQLTKRWDLVIYDHQFSPYMLVECKAPEVSLSDETRHQIQIYNSQLLAPFLLITNGISSFAYKVNHQKAELLALEELPPFK